ncbi:MAG: hypothetical protein ACREP4_01110 [Stenotrophomonas sp.]|uniref:hypothetical protein n=1 Tax=Stenotrophomonas sp. TaxID=69392 RepID=UPI003D6D7931
MIEETPAMDVNAVARLEMLRNLAFDLIGSHPQPAQAVAVIAHYRDHLKEILGSTPAGSREHAVASEGLAELRRLLARLKRAQERAREASDTPEKSQAKRPRAQEHER